MSKLCTFSGPHGDILWSLPTVRALSQLHGEKMDMAIRPDYKGLIPLLEFQPYISKAFVVEGWTLWHSNYADQPWFPPKEVEKGYERVFHLTYRHHPGITGKRLPLIDFTADQQGIKLKDPLPFLTVRQDLGETIPFVAIGFNKQYESEKKKFMERLNPLCVDIKLLDVTTQPWLDAATLIKRAFCFVGCRSSNNVMAHGVDQKNIFIFEPHPARNASGHLGDVFGCPYGQEVTAPWLAPPEVCAEMCADYIKNWKKESEKYETIAS